MFDRFEAYKKTLYFFYLSFRNQQKIFSNTYDGAGGHERENHIHKHDYIIITF